MELIGKKVKNATYGEGIIRQWLRRGKLRAIKKQGRDWLIASIAEKPS